MRTKKTDGSLVSCDAMVEVPYDKIMEDGSVTFFFRFVPRMKRTETSPEEGNHYEIIDMDGPVLDDDIPDLENEAFVKLDEEIDLYCDQMCR